MRYSNNWGEMFYFIFDLLCLSVQVGSSNLIHRLGPGGWIEETDVYKD